MDTATLFEYGQDTISESQFSLIFSIDLFVFHFVVQLIKCFLSGVNNANCPRVQGPPLRREGIPAQTWSPQIKKTPLGSCLGSFVDSAGSGAVTLHHVGMV